MTIGRSSPGRLRFRSTSQGGLSSVSIYGDAGGVFVTTSDAAGTQSRSQPITGYDSQGMDYVTIINDDGTAAYTDYDQANQSNILWCLYI